MSKIGVLGTGIVGRSHAEKLAELGHDVVIGTHDVAATMARKEKDAMGTPPFNEWQKDHQNIKLVTFHEAAAHGEIVIDALKGEGALSVLTTLGKELEGKLLIDLANPLDFSKGMPPSLTICNTDSLGEEVQKALPNVKVVKLFNTVNAMLQVAPRQLADGKHDLFMCGNDAEAKQQAAALAKSYGWENIIDLGDITNARGMEMLLPIWVRLFGAFKTPMFNFKIVR